MSSYTRQTKGDLLKGFTKSPMLCPGTLAVISTRLKWCVLFPASLALGVGEEGPSEVPEALPPAELGIFVRVLPGLDVTELLRRVCCMCLFCLLGFFLVEFVEFVEFGAFCKMAKKVTHEADPENVFLLWGRWNGSARWAFG